MTTWRQMPGIIQEIPDREGKKNMHDNYPAGRFGELDDISVKNWRVKFLFFNMFKKKQEILFVRYLTEYRMDKGTHACGNQKSYMIAKSVGYSDPNYFSYVFKDSLGYR